MEARAEWHSSAVCGKPPTTTELSSKNRDRVSSCESSLRPAAKELRACCANPAADSPLVFQHKPSSHRGVQCAITRTLLIYSDKLRSFYLDKNCMRLPKLNSQIGIVKFWVELGVVKNAGRVKEIASGRRRGRVHLTGVW